MSELQNHHAENDAMNSQPAIVADSRTKSESNEKSHREDGDSRNQNETEGVKMQNTSDSARGKKTGGRRRGSNVPRGPRGRSHRGSADDDRSRAAPKGRKSTDTAKGNHDNVKSAREQPKEGDQPASSSSGNSEDEDDDDDDNDDDDDDDDDDDEDEDEKAEEDHDQAETEGQADFDDNGAAKDSRRKGSSSDKQAEPSPGKGPAKRQPYVRQVDLPREKLSPADLEAKMAAMALKNAQLMEQKKAADQDAAEYREIELKSQRTFEAQRAQQQEIDAARKAAADRKLKKMQGREWDLEKTEDDWNRSRPYTDSMTNANPGRNSWNSHRGSGYRGRSARGYHPQGRGTGRGGRGGRRDPGGAEGDRSLPHDSAQGQESTSNGNDAPPST